MAQVRFGNLREDEFHALLARIWPQIETLLKAHKLVNVYLRPPRRHPLKISR